MGPYFLRVTFRSVELQTPLPTEDFYLTSSCPCWAYTRKSSRSLPLTGTRKKPRVPYLSVSATSEACHNLQGESPCRARRSQPPVSSLARCAESEISEYCSA